MEVARGYQARSVGQTLVPVREMQKLACLLLLCLVVSCHQYPVSESDVKRAQERVRPVTDAYNLAVADGKKNNRFVVEFHRLFPSAASAISYYTGEYGDPMWTSKAGIHGRYIRTMQFKIQLDQTTTRILTSSEPEFHLIEVLSVSAGLTRKG